MMLMPTIDCSHVLGELISCWLLWNSVWGGGDAGTMAVFVSIGESASSGLGGPSTPSSDSGLKSFTSGDATKVSPWLFLIHATGSPIFFLRKYWSTSG